MIYDVIACVLQRKKDEGEQTLLMKKLAEIDGSLLFKNYHLEDAPILEGISNTVITNLENLRTNFNDTNLQALLSSLTAYLRLMEIHIVGQMVIDKDVEAYIKDDDNNVDCTISCVRQVLEKTLEELKKQELETQK